MIAIVINGELLNSPVGFEPDPQKANAAGKWAFTGATGTQHRPSAKEFSTLQAQAARAGHELTTSRHETGLTLWMISRWGQARQYSEWSDVCTFIAHVSGTR